MKFEAKDYTHLIGIKGLSEQLLKNHFILYNGYVTNTNKLLDILTSMLKEGKTGTPEYSELQRRFGWEFNGMRLHELYFSNLTKDNKKFNTNSKLSKEITKIYGNYENWEKNFKVVGAMRGIGWAILVYDPQSKELFNIWINEHDMGHLAGGIPLLIMDVFEHAFMIDYGTNRIDYIKTFFENIDWEEIEKRYENHA